MNSPLIKKDLANYINSNVFINLLNIPLYGESDYNYTIQKNSKIIGEKLDILMKVPHREFWCHIVYDSSILRSLQSFCNNATRPYEMTLEEIVLQNFEIELQKKFYLLILRIVTNKETTIPEFSNTNFGNLLYDNFIVDIPLLFDICSLYGEENPEMISKMLISIFTCQPKYLIDLKSYAVQTMKFFEDKIVSVISTTVEKNNIFTLKTTQLSEEETNNLLKSIIDICHSWHIMLNAAKSKDEIFLDLVDISFHKSLEKLLEKTVPFMQAKIDKFETSNQKTLKKLLSVECFYLINVWRDIFNEKFLRKINDTCTKDLVSEDNFSLIRDCLAFISSCQEYPIFADAMYLMFPINDDFELIFQAVTRDKNEYYSEFIHDSVNEIIGDIAKRETIFSCKMNKESKSLLKNKQEQSQFTDSANMNIRQVLDMFPDLLESDIKAYLQCYKCSPENMVEALLDGAIDIEFVRKTASEMNEEILNRREVCQSVLVTHRNIYDGDDMDQGRVSASQLHLGKRQTELAKTIDPDLCQMIMGIVIRQQEDEETAMDALSSLDRNLNYEDEQDDVYGISHDAVVIDNKNGQDSSRETDIPSHKAYRIPNNTKENKGAKAPVVVEKDESIIMEPSKLKYSHHEKRQFLKKRFHEGTGGNANGNISKRQGSHAKNETTTKKDHRSKPERNKIID